jgi:hypothetical protein
MFPASAVERFEHTASEQFQPGFSLNELWLEIRRNRDSGVPCHRVLSLTEGNLQFVGQRIQAPQRIYVRKLVRDLAEQAGIQ